MPAVAVALRQMNMVPVDYVVQAMDHIAHLPRTDGKCFHMTDPKPMRIGEGLNLLAESAHAPHMSVRADARLVQYMTAVVKK